MAVVYQLLQSQPSATIPLQSKLNIDDSDFLERFFKNSLSN